MLQNYVELIKLSARFRNNLRSEIDNENKALSIFLEGRGKIMNKFQNKFAVFTFCLLMLLAMSLSVFAQMKEAKLITADGESDLTANGWQLIKINGEIINTDKAFINFDLTKNAVGGKGGCNGFGGDLEINGNEIKISRIISTKMFCEATSEIENKFFTKLAEAERYEIKDGKLFLSNGEKKLLEFLAKK